MTEIPHSVIGVVAEILSDFYSHKELNRLFRAKGDISVDDCSGNKSDKVIYGLDKINSNAQMNQDNVPLIALGKILEDYMDESLPIEEDIFGNKNKDNLPADKQRHENREKIRNVLKDKGLIYNKGGTVSKISASARVALELTDQIKAQGLPAVQQEIERAIQDLNDGDSGGAIHRAGALLEAVYKAYLDKYGKIYGDKDTAAVLWKKVSKHLGIRPREQNVDEMRNIYSALHQIAQNMGILRNRHGGHGQNQEQYEVTQTITTADANLAVNAAATLAYYITQSTPNA